MAPLLSRRLAAGLAIASQLACASTGPAEPPASGHRQAAAPAAGPQTPLGTLELLGETALPAGLEFGETVVGGLSGITYDAGRDRYYAVSDDPGGKSPARFYTLRLELGAAGLRGAAVEAVTILRDRTGRPFPKLVMDAEGIALTPRGTLLISSEGNVEEGVAPSLREFGLDGRQLRELVIARRYRPRVGRSGVRHNKAFEALALAPSGDRFYLASENAIHQDGPVADVDHGSLVRIQTYDTRSGRPIAEHVYRVEPVATPPAASRDFRTNGLVELLALPGGELLALERSYTVGAAHTVRLFQVSLRGATDVRRVGRLGGRRAGRYTPAAKRLLLDLEELGLRLDNLEGITFGPRLADGRRTLVLVSDDNFDERQRTQLLALAVQPSTVSQATDQN